MAYTYGNSESYPEANRTELIDSANRGTGGSGAIVEASLRLADAIKEQEAITIRLNKSLLWYTVVIAAGTIALVILEGMHFVREHGNQPKTIKDAVIAESSQALVLLSTYNVNSKCIGHATHLCGPEKESLITEIAGVFATEPTCEGIRLRGLNEKEASTPTGQLPLLVQAFYEGTHSKPYMGTGKNENEGWMFTFNGPHGHFSATARTEQEIASRVCSAAKGHGAEIDKNVGYTN